MIRARIRVDGRLAGGLQALLGAPLAAYSGCAERDSGIGRSKRHSLDWAGKSWRGRSVVRWVAQAPTLPSGRKWNGSQPCQGAAELGFPRPALGQMQGGRAERVSRPARAKNRRRRVLVVTICSPRPMRAVQRARFGPSPGRPARRRWRRSGPRGDGLAPRRT